MNTFLSLALLFSAAGFANPTVVVVGAGIAGLTTAYRLQQKGVDVQIYDARNRVGGRIFSVKIGDTIGELGGQNINDGGKAENIYRLIDEFQLELTDTRVILSHDYFNGEMFIPQHFEVIEDLETKIADAAQKSEDMRDVLNRFFKADDPRYKSLSVRMAAYEGASIEKLSPLYSETLYHMIQGGISSVHPSTEERHIDLVSVKGGNAVLTEKLAEMLGDRVHLNMPLVEVSKKENGSYELLFRNGQKVEADILVVALPCSVYSDIVFEEGIIPEERLEAIRNVQYGTNAKVLVPFHQRTAKRLTFINDRIISFFNGDRTVLTLYYTGDSGLFSEHTILQTYQLDRPMLELGFGDLCPPLVTPAIARDGSLVSYEGPVGHSWPNDPYVKGSYSYIAPGQEELLTATQNEGDERVRTLFAPIDRTLYFAGEHATILMDVPGTMEAACESGERTARMILRTPS
jgi:monoamine oxidase